MKTTKDIRAKLAQICELQRTNRFKRSLDIALAQEIPVEIRVARPFKAFEHKSGRRYKVKVVNTKAGTWYPLCRVKMEKHEERREWLAGGVCYIGYTLESVVEESRKRCGPQVAEPKDVSTWANWEEVIERTSWAEIGLAISKLFKSDLVYFETCGKCSGTGFIPAFAHVYDGVCFDCLGTGGRLALGAADPAKIKA